MSEETATAFQEEQDAQKLNLKVEIETTGPCLKHVSVTVPRSDLDLIREMTIEEFTEEASVPGFRQGKVPQWLLEKRFKEELKSQMKQKILLQSLDQVSSDHDLDAINQPDIDVENLDIPDEGDFEYEFEVEVRPTFDLPDFASWKIDRPSKEIGDEEIELALSKWLAQYGQVVPKEGAVEAGDHAVVNMVFTHNGEEIRRMEEKTLNVQDILRLQDAEVTGFGEALVGANSGDKKSLTTRISTESPDLEMRDEEVSIEIEVLDVKQMEMPEMTEEFLGELGFETEEKLRDYVKESLERQVTYQQRQQTRQQVIDKITDSANWELPEGLLRSQTDNALRREILEMQQAGFSRQEIAAREAQIKQNSLTNTKQALKEHFVLDRVASENELEPSQEELEMEMQMMAYQRGENPRKLRARLIKSGMIDNLEAQIRERKAVDFILEKAQFEDTPMEDSIVGNIETLQESILGFSQTEGEAEAEADTEE